MENLIIPYDILSERDLMPGAKLLYALITSLINDEGFCYTTNEYFKNFFSVEEKIIKNWLASLKKKEYIKIKLLKNNRRETCGRRIYIKEIVQKNKILKPNSSKNKLDEGTQEKLDYNDIKNNVIYLKILPNKNMEKK